MGFKSVATEFCSQVQGLCGNMDGDATNDWTSKSGMQEQLLDFGVSYALCQNALANTPPDQDMKPCSIYSQVSTGCLKIRGAKNIA